MGRGGGNIRKLKRSQYNNMLYTYYTRIYIYNMCVCVGKSSSPETIELFIFMLIDIYDFLRLPFFL